MNTSGTSANGSALGIILRLGHLLDPGGQLVLPDKPGAKIAGWQSRPGVWFRHVSASSADAAVQTLAEELIRYSRIQDRLWSDSFDASTRDKGRSLRVALLDIEGALDGESCEHCGRDGTCLVCKGAA